VTRRLGGLVLAGALAAAPALAASPPASLGEASGRIDRAVRAIAGSATPEARVLALSEAISAYEGALAALRATVFGAEERERSLTLDLLERRAEIVRLVVALETLSRRPRPAQALHPQGPLAAARAATMLARTAPALQEKAQVLADQLAEIEAARALRAQAMADIDAGLDELGAARDALAAALDGRAGALVANPSIPAGLLRDAETLSDLSDRIARLGGGEAPAATAQMRLRWPVAGRVLRNFRAPDAAGVRRPGLLVEAAPLSLVTAPADARVRYAGPFLDYGYVVVLEPRRDVLIVLAGLATIETTTGSALRAGAPLGLLGGRALDAQEYLMLGRAQESETPTETLYIEIRHGRGPVDPAPWFATPNG
jgi:murein hydrolase activator